MKRFGQLLMLVAVQFCFAEAASAVYEKGVAIQRNGSELPSRFGYGINATYDHEAGIVSAYDRSGNQTMSLLLTLPNAGRISIRDVAPGPDNTVAVAAAARNQDGLAASVIFYVTTSGTVIQVVRTSPFAPFRLAFAPDGALWAAGREHDADNRDVPGHSIVRRYGADGTLLQTLLSIDTFASRKIHPGVESFLVDGPDRMGVFCRPTNEYIEYSLTGVLLGRWSIPKFPKSTLIFGAGMPSGTLFLSGMDSGETRLYEFDRATGTFVGTILTHPSDNQGIKMSTIVGTDAQHLVLYGQNHLSWYRVDPSPSPGGIIPRSSNP